MTNRTISHTDRWHAEPIPKVGWAVIKDENGLAVGTVIKEDAPLAATAPHAADLLRRILGMHESHNCGAYNGEAILSESVADEIRHLLKEAKIKPDNWKREG